MEQNSFLLRLCSLCHNFIEAWRNFGFSAVFNYDGNGSQSFDQSQISKKPNFTNKKIHGNQGKFDFENKILYILILLKTDRYFEVLPSAAKFSSLYYWKK